MKQTVVSYNKCLRDLFLNEFIEKVDKYFFLFKDQIKTENREIKEVTMISLKRVFFFVRATVKS